MVETAPIILTAKMGKGDQRWANALRQAHFPPERNYLDAHITLFHHLPPQHWPEIKRELALMASQYARPLATMSEVMMLGRGVAYRIESPILLAMRDRLAEAFHGLLIPQDQAQPRLHITVQNKVKPAEAKALHAELSAEFAIREIAVTGLSAHYYRSGPWEHIGDYLFRGKCAPDGY